MRLKHLFFIFLFWSITNSFCSEPFIEGTFLADQKGREQFLNCIKTAESPVILGAYKLHQGILPDKEIFDSVKNLTDRGVCVKLFTESRLTYEEMRGYVDLPVGLVLKEFQSTGATLITNVKDYGNLHIKLLLTPKYAVLGTTNYDGVPSLDPGREWRDFSCILMDKRLLDELRSTLTWVEKGIPVNWPVYKISSVPDNQTRLTWGPIQHKSHILEMIDSAKKNIVLYQQDLQDKDIIEALKEKAAGGVCVRVLMSYHPFGETNDNKSLPNLHILVQAGGQVRLTGKVKIIENRPLHIHAKAMIIDDSVGYIGSANFYPAVLDPRGNNLNLGIITRESKFISTICQTFEKDWKDHTEHDLKRMN